MRTLSWLSCDTFWQFGKLYLGQNWNFIEQRIGERYRFHIWERYRNDLTCSCNCYRDLEIFQGNYRWRDSQIVTLYQPDVAVGMKEWSMESAPLPWWSWQFCDLIGICLLHACLDVNALKTASPGSYLPTQPGLKWCCSSFQSLELHFSILVQIRCNFNTGLVWRVVTTGIPLLLWAQDLHMQCQLKPSATCSGRWYTSVLIKKCVTFDLRWTSWSRAVWWPFVMHADKELF